MRRLIKIATFAAIMLVTGQLTDSLLALPEMEPTTPQQMCPAIEGTPMICGTCAGCEVWDNFGLADGTDGVFCAYCETEGGYVLWCDGNPVITKLPPWTLACGSGWSATFNCPTGNSIGCDFWVQILHRCGTCQ